MTVDGNIGPLTAAAIKSFQTDNGVTADGVVGNATWPLLIEEVSEGDNGDAVRAAQDQLSIRTLPQTLGLAVNGSYWFVLDLGPLPE